MYFSARGEVAKSIAKVAYEQGFIAFDKVLEFDSEQLARCAGHSHAALIFGGNARERTVRAEKLLGYTRLGRPYLKRSHRLCQRGC